MKTKNILNILTIFLVCYYSPAQETNKEKESTFKKIIEASYSSKRSGVLTREKTLNQKINKEQFYNEQGVLTEYWRYEVDGTIYEKTVLTKNNDGKLIKSITSNKSGNLKKYTTTEFDNNQNIIEYKTYNSEDKLTSIQKNEYDANENKVSMSNISIKSNRTFKTTYEYNSKNELIKEIDFKPDGTIKDTRVFKYDENGNEIESELTRPNGDYTKFISEYDDLNNMTVQNWYDNKGKQKHQTSFTYVYDEKNNWITKKRYSNDELGYVWERQIEYY